VRHTFTTMLTQLIRNTVARILQLLKTGTMQGGGHSRKSLARRRQGPARAATA
jgi:hypothetical protein